MNAFTDLFRGQNYLQSLDYKSCQHHICQTCFVVECNEIFHDRKTGRLSLVFEDLEYLKLQQLQALKASVSRFQQRLLPCLCPAAAFEAKYLLTMLSVKPTRKLQFLLESKVMVMAKQLHNPVTWSNVLVFGYGRYGQNHLPLVAAETQDIASMLPCGRRLFRCDSSSPPYRCTPHAMQLHGRYSNTSVSSVSFPSNSTFFASWVILPSFHS